MNKRCLVTGASGHLGSFVAEELVRRGWDCLALIGPISDLWRLRETASLLDKIKVIRTEYEIKILRHLVQTRNL